MQVAKWGNSLAVRLPAELVRRAGLKEGDDVELQLGSGGALVLMPDAVRREQIFERISELARPLPADYKFDREEANARGSGAD